MSMSDAHRKVLLENTRPAAAEFLGDLKRMREALDRSSHSRDEVRMLSVTLRRLLVNSVMSVIAAPRIGKFKVEAPDIKPIPRPPDVTVIFHATGLLTRRKPQPFAWLQHLRAEISKIPGHTVTPQFVPPIYKFVPLSLNRFLNQDVLGLNDEWVNRRQVIKYVYIVEHVSHSESLKTNEDRILAIISRCVKCRRTDDDQIQYEIPGRFPEHPEIWPFSYDPDDMNPILIELLAIAEVVLDSEHTKRLEAIITEELCESRHLKSDA